MSFGANPGNLRMFVYVPERLPNMAPLVVALHGCSQSADDYDYGSGWSTLAERLGFAVVFPEQQPTNNPKNCFSWFLSGDIARGHARRIRSSRWSSTPSQASALIRAGCSYLAYRPAAPWPL